jgi:hypothetical protein
MTRSSSRVRSIATCHIDRHWSERPCNHRDKWLIARSHGVNRSVRRWPSVVHDDAVLGGVQGALRRLRRPGHRLRAAPDWLLPTAIKRGAIRATSLSGSIPVRLAGTLSSVPPAGGVRFRSSLLK